jgi:hypothetical protein
MHIGAHKTATTHLQHTLEANTALLREAGVQYRGPRDFRGDGRTLQNRFGLLSEGEVSSPHDPERELAELAGGAQRLVISEENIAGPIWQRNNGAAGPLYPRADAHLAKLLPQFGGRPLSLFLSVRNPAGFVASTYTQALLGGRIQPFERFTEGLALTQMRWSNLVRRLSLLPDVAEIFVWKYEDYPAIQVRMLRKMVGWKLGPQVVPIDGRVHQGMSSEAVKHVLALGNSAPKTRDERRILVHALRDEYPASEILERFSPWAAEARRLAATAYEHDLAEIAAMDKVQIIHPWKGGR